MHKYAAVDMYATSLKYYIIGHYHEYPCYYGVYTIILPFSYGYAVPSVSVSAATRLAYMIYQVYILYIYVDTMSPDQHA